MAWQERRLGHGWLAFAGLRRSTARIFETRGFPLC
jgi:hypothetical protein